MNALSKHGSMDHAILYPSKRSHLIQIAASGKQNLNKNGSMDHSIRCPNKRSCLVQTPGTIEQTCNKHDSMQQESQDKENNSSEI